MNSEHQFLTVLCPPIQKISKSVDLVVVLARKSQEITKALGFICQGP